MMDPEIIAVLSLLSALFSLGLAIFVISRNPKQKVNQSFATGMLALSLIEFGNYMSFSGSVAAPLLFWKKLSFAGQALLPGSWLMFSLTFGRSDPSRYLKRWRFWIASVYLVALGFLVAHTTDWVLTEEQMFRRGGYWFSVFLLLVLTLVLANFEATFRSADLEQRWRIKYLILGLGFIFVAMIYVLSQILLFSSIGQGFSPMISAVILVGCCLVTFSLVRYRLLDVDIFISRYVIYNSITLVVVGIYLLIVGGLIQVIKTLGWKFDITLGSFLVFLSILFLAIVLLSYNVRKRVKLFIDKNFYKNKHDYRKEWLELADRLTSKLNVQDLLPVLSKMIFDTFWIKQTFFWLRDDSEKEFQPVRLPGNPPFHPVEWKLTLIQALRDRDYPLVFDGPPEDPTSEPEYLGALGEPQKDALRSMGVLMLVPLVVEKQLIGIMGLSKSQAGTPLNYEDYDLMKTMAKQAASSILNAKLYQRLVHSKELETFHAFSIFLLHDLKNFVAMISLVVENMNQNFENPDFRKDALTSLSLTVEKMKRLMDRLAALSKAPDLNCASVDLNAVIQETLDEIKTSIKSKIVRNLGELPALQVDPAQIKTVVANLLLNAEEAITGEGEIRLTTEVRDGMVTLSVSDNGCGIPGDFLENRLFKPFSTTKSQGFGIGLYQLKRILEANGGNIQANSEVGKGSTFTVALPIENRI